MIFQDLTLYSSLFFLINLGIGLTTPPVGAGLFVGCTVGKITVGEAAKSTLALWPALIIVLLLVTFIPWLTMFLPNLIR